MAKIANVALTDTFNTWRTRSNQTFDRVSQFAINNSSLYANTLTSNSSFTAKGLATFNGRATVGTNLTVSGNTTFGGAGKVSNTTGWFGVAGRATVSTNLFVGGNTALGGTGKTANVQGWFGVAGRASVSTNLFVGANTYVMGSMGIGTTSPGTYGGKLSVISAASTQATVLIQNPGQGSAHLGFAASSSNIKLYNCYATGLLSGGSGIDIDTNGNVGIGTTSPGVILQVTGTTLNTSVLITNSASGLNIGTIANYATWQGSGTSDDFVVAGYGARNLILGTNAAERMRIASSGLVTACNSMTVTQNLTVSGNTTLNGTTVDKSNTLSQTLTDGATINWDVALGRVATVTLGAAGRTMAAPTNLKVGTYILRVYQDATGSRTITTWNSVFKWTAAVAPVLSTGASKLDIITFFSDGTNLYGSYLPDMR